MNQALTQWVQKSLKQHLGDIDYQLKPLNGDAGFRSYYRVNIQQCENSHNELTPLHFLAVNSPPATESNQAFIDIANAFKRQGVQAPQVIDADMVQGFLLIQDFGDRQLIDSLKETSATDSSVDSLYVKALKSLLQIQLCQHEPSIFPAYDDEKFRQEYQLFSDWFLKQYLGLPLTPSDTQIIENFYKFLKQCIDEQPKVVVHRDYHSRNLMLCDNGTLGIIDFQDAVIGPITYDVVSLLKDCYIQWPRDRVKSWAQAYSDMAANAGVIPPLSGEGDQQKWLRWFDFTGLHRHLKVLGIFVRLSYRDNKHGYLKDLPMVFDYVQRTLLEYAMIDDASEYSPQHSSQEMLDNVHLFFEWFSQKVVPAFNAKRRENTH